jgi:hypothetical protein
MVIYIVITVIGSWAFGAAAYFLQDSMGKLAGLVMLPMLVVPLIAALIAHRSSGAVGNPFRGLVWGGGGWIFGVWLLGLVAGLLVVVVSIGLNLQGLDLEMRDYVQFVLEQQEAAGQTVPESAQGFLKIGGWSTLGGMPLIGVWFMAAMFCLGTFPWLGWLGRRLLARGSAAMGAWWLAVLLFLTGVAGGTLENPMWGETSMLMRMVLTGLFNAALVPAIWWLFLKTKSAVVPAIAEAGYVAMLQGLVPILTASDYPMLTPPQGLLVPLGALFIGIALWIWQDPGGRDLAVAGVAHDGTPLTPDMLAHLEAEERTHDAQHAAPAAPE